MSHTCRNGVAKTPGIGVRQSPNRGPKRRVTLAGPCPSSRLRKAKASDMPATRLLRFNRKSVAPCRRPVTRPVTTGGISVRVSSLARARSSHRANKNNRQWPGAASAAWKQSKPHGTPRRDTKTLFALQPLKSVLVSRPLAGLFSILHARALLPPRSAPNCKQTGIEFGAYAPVSNCNFRSEAPI